MNVEKIKTIILVLSLTINVLSLTINVLLYILPQGKEKKITKLMLENEYNDSIYQLELEKLNKINDSLKTSYKTNIIVNKYVNEKANYINLPANEQLNLWTNKTNNN